MKTFIFDRLVDVDDRWESVNTIMTQWSMTNSIAPFDLALSRMRTHSRMFKQISEETKKFAEMGRSTKNL